MFVLRPEPGLTESLISAFERGIAARGMPLAKVEPLAWKAPAEPFDALLAGSANVFRHGGKELEKIRHLPVHAVGEATAQAAREAGFAVAHIGEGGLQSLLIDAPRRLLRLAGEAHVELDSPPGTTIVTQVVYAVRYLALTPAQADLIQQDGIVLLHSGEMARHFGEQCETLGVDRARITLITLAPRIGSLAGEGWRSVHIAAGRTDAALLDSVAELCQKQVTK